jgi:hypothetical protein
MTDFRLLGRVHSCCFLAVLITFGWQQFAQAQENDGAKSRIAPSISSAFAVGGSARKELPPLDPLYCPGPAACAPCDSHHSGFLYYGTCPDDGCANRFYKCPAGDCGHFAIGLSRAWIHLHSSCRRAFRWSHPTGDDCGGSCEKTGKSPSD